jgi:hypothetical protein
VALAIGPNLGATVDCYLPLVDPASASVFVTSGSLSIEPVEQVSKIVSVIKIKVNLFHVVHQRGPVRDRINNCPQVTTRQLFHRIPHRRIKAFMIECWQALDWVCFTLKNGHSPAGSRSPFRARSGSANARALVASMLTYGLRLREIGAAAALPNSGHPMWARAFFSTLKIARIIHSGRV